MYVSGGSGDVYALDARTGHPIWAFHRKQDIKNPYQINPYNRGVAVLDGRVFVGTLDDNLIALDAHTGRELWEMRIADTLEGYHLDRRAAGGERQDHHGHVGRRDGRARLSRRL